MEVLLAEDDNVVEALTPNRAEETFADRVEVRRLRRNGYNVDASPFRCSGESRAIFPIVVTDQKSWSFSPWRGFAQLPGHPLVIRRPSHVEVHDLAAAVLHHKNAKMGLNQAS